MLASPKDNSADSPSSNTRADMLKSDSAAYAVLRECRFRSLTVGVILCRKLDEDMSAIEAAQATHDAKQQRSSDGDNNCNSSNEQAEEHSESQLRSSTDNTDPNRELSLFTPVVDSETESSVSHGDEVAPTTNLFYYSPGRIVSNPGQCRMRIQTFLSFSSTEKVEKADNMFPCPYGRWDCGTFLGKRVFVETNNSFLGRGSLAVVLGGNIIVMETVDGEERCLASIPVAIKEITYNARQKEVRNMLERGLKFRLEVEHPGFVTIFHTGGYYPPFSRLSKMTKVPIFSHLSLACSTTGSIADVLKRAGPFSMSEIRHCMSEVLATLQFMHDEHHWVHNDIKSHNILIFDNPSAFSSYKYQLSDFTGVARAQSFEEVMRGIENELGAQLETTTVGGTAAFMSPESCLGLGMLTSNDIWSLGITAYHMATNTLPWKPLERQFPSMILNGYRCKYTLKTIFGKSSDESRDAPLPNQTSANHNPLQEGDEGGRESSNMADSSAGSAVFHAENAEFGPILEEFEQNILLGDFQDFVRQCLIENPMERPTAKQLREHAFVKGERVGNSPVDTTTSLPS
jgi:serine/threonine protein kinase